MKVSKLAPRPLARRVMGIDASTQSIAFCIYYNRKPVSWGKLRLEGGDSFAKIGDAAKKMNTLLDRYEVDYIAIEQAIFVNNLGVVKKLAYVFGAILGQAGLRNIPIIDVAPLTWQSALGNPTWTRQQKAAFKKANPGKSKSWYSAQMRKQRKQRTIDLINQRWGLSLTDDDVADACGVADYAYKQLTRRS